MLRPLRESDSEAVVACYRSAYGDERQIDAETIVGWCRNPEFKPDWMQVLELDDEVVGYGDIWIGDEEAELDLAAPGHWETFLDWGESRGRSAGVARMRATFPVPHELQQVVAARGYRFWRSAYTMQIEFDDASPEAPVLPNEIELRGYEPADAEALRATLNEAFARDPFFHRVTPESFGAFYLGTRGFDPSLWLLAWADGELAACLLAYPEFGGDRASARFNRWVSGLSGAGGALLQRSSARRSASCIREGCGECAWVSTPRTRRERFASTSVSGCRSYAAKTTGCSSSRASSASCGRRRGIRGSCARSGGSPSTSTRST